METQLEDVLEKCVNTPLTTGAIVINDVALCIGWRGDLHEDDAEPIARLIARATEDAEDCKGEIPYKSKRLQFHKNPEFTLALLRSHIPSPPASVSDNQTVSQSVGSLQSAETTGTVRPTGITHATLAND